MLNEMKKLGDFIKELRVPNRPEYMKTYVVLVNIRLMININDCFGHIFGDEIITSNVKFLKSIFKDYEIYRVGGDEFAIILPDDDIPSAFEKINNVPYRQVFGDGYEKIVLGLTSYSGSIMLDKRVGLPYVKMIKFLGACDGKFR